MNKDNKYMNVIAAYAKNRQDLSELNEKIDSLLSDNYSNDLKEFFCIDINKFRELLYLENKNTRWEGWRHCLDISGEDFTDNEWKLAELLDQKKKIKYDAGQIKRNICAIGRGILREYSGLGS